MAKIYPDLVERYKLETEFFPDHVTHARYMEKLKNGDTRAKENWSNSGELGKGGFGVVHKQIQKTTGHYRAVKTIGKKIPGLDYSREVLAMAILAKHPSLFVEFLGWFEEPETLYIAMEYLEEGDLRKHSRTPLVQETVRAISKQLLQGLEVMHQEGMAHRDLKPENIFVVSMSPVWVKLGDFGISKRIPAEATTTFHTQVSTPVYSAPEVLGLDSHSETSDYTNSVDIWSLGCVIYELLAGKRLFVSEGEVFRYYLGSWHFPEDELKGLSPPASNVGISLLKSMLTIQPENRPTAAGALGHAWLMGLKSDNKAGGDGQDETTQSRGESSQSRKGEKKLAIHDKREKSRNIRSPITREDTKYTLGDAALAANPGSQMGIHPSTTSESAISTSAMTPPVASSVEGALIETGYLESELMPRDFRETHPKCFKVLRKRQICSIPQTCPQNLHQAISQRRIKPWKQMDKWTTPQSSIPSPPFLTQTKQKLHTDEPALPGTAGSVQTIRKLQRAGSHRIPPLTSAVEAKVEIKMAPQSIQYKVLTPEETLIRDRILLLAGILILATALSGTRILAGILMLVGIISGTLMLPGAPTSGGIEISGGTQAVISRKRTRMRKRYQRGRGRIQRKREK